jgi:hypothetical protein
MQAALSSTLFYVDCRLVSNPLKKLSVVCFLTLKLHTDEPKNALGTPYGPELKHLQICWWEPTFFPRLYSLNLAHAPPDLQHMYPVTVITFPEKNESASIFFIHGCVKR